MKEIGVGDILSRMAKIVQDSGRATLIFTLVLGGLGAGAVLLGFVDTSQVRFGPSVGMMINEDTSLMSGLYDLAVLLVAIVAYYLLMREQLASQNRLGGNTGSFWLFLGMSILALIGVVIGFMLILVPGIIIMVRWAAANGLVIGKAMGPVDALKVSWDATDGHSWPIFLAGVVLMLGVFVGAAIVMAPLAMASLTVAAIAGAFFEAFANALNFAFSIAVYCLLVDDDTEMAEVFA